MFNVTSELKSVASTAAEISLFSFNSIKLKHWNVTCCDDRWQITITKLSITAFSSGVCVKMTSTASSQLTARLTDRWHLRHWHSVIHKSHRGRMKERLFRVKDSPMPYCSNSYWSSTEDMTVLLKIQQGKKKTRWWFSYVDVSHS